MSKPRRRALIVEDDPGAQRLIAELLRREGIDVRIAASLAAMDLALHAQSFDLLFLDVELGDGNGLDHLPELTMSYPHLRVIVVTSHSSIELAVRAIQRGASDFIEKPIGPEALKQKLNEICVPQATASGSLLHQDAARHTGLIGESPAIYRVLEQVLRMKDVDSTVLIYGESGTGKELVARSLHSLSHRSLAPFSAVNCAAIPETLLEAELFGARKGAFTDAKTDRKGHFETCSDGTLLLDEIGEMPFAMQSKLLRVLQEKEVTPLGASRAVKVNTRVIAATNRRLEDQVAKGSFREDLFYRLSVLQILIPPLRERREDIPVLARYFVKQLAARLGKDIEPPRQELLARLIAHKWPGNVRELQNSLERAIVLSSDGRLRPEDILRGGDPFSASRQPTVDYNNPLSLGSLKEAKDRYEEFYLRELAREAQGNVALMAKTSGRVRTDMYRLFDKYHLDPNSFKHS